MDRRRFVKMLGAVLAAPMALAAGKKAVAAEGGPRWCKPCDDAAWLGLWDGVIGAARVERHYDLWWIPSNLVDPGPWRPYMNKFDFLEQWEHFVDVEGANHRRHPDCLAAIGPKERLTWTPQDGVILSPPLLEAYRRAVAKGLIKPPEPRATYQETPWHQPYHADYPDYARLDNPFYPTLLPAFGGGHSRAPWPLRVRIADLIKENRP